MLEGIFFQIFSMAAGIDLFFSEFLAEKFQKIINWCLTRLGTLGYLVQSRQVQTTHIRVRISTRILQQRSTQREGRSVGERLCTQVDENIEIPTKMAA